jgi:hypothetical protein
MRDRGETHASGTAVQTGPSPIFTPHSTGPAITGPFAVAPFDAAAHIAPPRTALPHTTPRLTMPPPTVSFPAVEELRSTWSIEPNLSARGPAYTVMQGCLALQASAAQRGRVARMLGRSPLNPDARSWYRGALGEVVVANVLSQLGPEWTVLHAVPVGQLGPAGSSHRTGPDGSAGSTIDHVILGPGGIFTINTKNHSGKKIWIGGGTFLVNGYKEPHMRSSVREAESASRLLSDVTGRPVVVTPVIVVVNPASITTGRKPPRVAVLASDTLKRWLVRRPRVLSDRAVAHFSMFAEEPSTWRAEPILVEETERHVQAFERLRTEVDAARQRARLWLLALGVVAILCAPLVTVGIMRVVDSLLTQTGN